MIGGHKGLIKNVAVQKDWGILPRKSKFSRLQVPVNYTPVYKMSYKNTYKDNSKRMQSCSVTYFDMIIRMGPRFWILDKGGSSLIDQLRHYFNASAGPSDTTP